MDPTFSENMEWNGRPLVRQFYASADYAGLAPVTQVQAVCFLPDGRLLGYRHADGYVGLPGGHPEIGESFEMALRREVLEETAAEVIACGPAGYNKVWFTDDPTGSVHYQLRYWARVTEPRGPVADPAHGSVGAEFMAPEELREKLGWGAYADAYYQAALAACRAAH